jgi:hypothetical protein
MLGDLMQLTAVQASRAEGTRSDVFIPENPARVFNLQPL